MACSRVLKGVATVGVLIALLLCECTIAISFPGTAATAYKAGFPLRVEVNDVRSVKNPVQLDFYSNKLPYHAFAFEKPKGYSSAFDLGAILTGERRRWSPYVLPVNEDSCFSLGETELDARMIRRVIKLIRRRYRVQMVVDGLPAINNGTSVLRHKCDKAFYNSWPKVANYQRGYYIGVSEKCIGQPLLNNHVHFTIGLYPLDKEEEQYFQDMSIGEDLTVMRQSKHMPRSAGRKAAAGANRKIVESPTGEKFLVVSVNLEPYSIDWRGMATEDKPYTLFCKDAPQAYKSAPKLSAMPAIVKTAADRRYADVLEAEGLGELSEDPEDLQDEDDDVYTGENDDNDDFDEGDLEDFWGNDYSDDEDAEDPLDPDDADIPEFYEDEEDYGDDTNAWLGDETGQHDGDGAPAGQAESFLGFLAQYSKDKAQKLPKKEASAISVRWTYSVKWKTSRSVKWATRWDAYFKNHPLTVKQSSFMLSILLSSGVIAALMSFVVAVLVRTLRRDLMKSVQIYLSPEDERVAQEEENGWKSVRGDVFRPPPRANLLIVAATAGAQALLTFSLAILFGLAGFAAPSNRGGLASLLLFFFLLSSFVGGALCAWLSLALGQPKRWSTIAELLLGFSGAVLATFTAVNVVLRFAGSSGAVPVAQMTLLYALWLFVFCPLGFLGAAAGFATRYKPADKVAAVQRVIDYNKVWSLFRTPGLLWYSGVPSFFVGSFLLKIIMNGLWGGLMLYVFGFMTITGFLWVVSCALTSISVVYYNLCGENHRWHWLSFIAPSSAGLPPALFVMWYFFAYMRSTTLTAILIYFLYMTLFTYLYVIIAGAIGFLSSFAFVRFIYNTAKSD